MPSASPQPNPRQLRIGLVINGLELGGAEALLVNEAEDLKAAGDAVHVFLTQKSGVLAERLRARQIPVHLLGMRHPFDLRRTETLIQTVRREGITLLHSHLALADLVARYAKIRLPGLHHVVTVHNPGVEQSRLKRGLWMSALLGSDRVLGVSDRVCQSLAAWLRPRRFYPSLVDLEAPLLAREAARAELGLDPKRPLILAVGRLVPIKGFELLKAAAEQLPPEIEVAVIGEGPEAKRLSGGRLRLLGAIPQSGRLLKAADLLVLPSRSEGFPQILLEAIRAETRIVATRVGGVPELMIDPALGEMVPPGDPQALLHGIQRQHLKTQEPHPGEGFLKAKEWTRQANAKALRRLFLELHAPNA